MTAIRTATAEDLTAMARLHGESFADGWSVTSLADLIASPGVSALLAQTGAVVQGFVLTRIAADEAEILTICVSPAWRRNGLGSVLLRAAAGKAAQMQARQMFLEVAETNLAAKTLYENHGFRPVGQRKAYYQGGDARVLKAALPLVGKAGETL